MKKVGLNGVGNLGSQLASRLLYQSNISEIRIFDRSPEYLEGKVLDLLDEASIIGAVPEIKVCSEFEELLNTDLIVSAIKGDYDYRKFKPEDLRTIGAQNDFPLVRQMCEIIKLNSYDGIFLNAGNPLDVTTAIIGIYSGLDPNRLFGFGMSLDEQRARRIIAKYANVNPDEVDVNIIGEHGDTMVPIYSTTQVCHKYILELDYDLETISNEIKMAGATIVKKLGYTKFGPATSLVEAISFLLEPEESVPMPFSVKFKDAFIGLPVRYEDGLFQPYLPEMTLQEFEAFEKSYNKIKDMFKELDKYAK